MAGLVSDSTDRRGNRRGSVRRRSGFMLDMTPLVDVAFLLLTFFMFATTMVRPQIMEIRVPPDLTAVPVSEKNLLTIYIGGNGRTFYSDGRTQDLTPIGSDDLRKFCVDRNTMYGNRLVTVLKADPDVPYAAIIGVLDQLNLAEADLTEFYADRGEMRERRFALTAMSDGERRKIVEVAHRR